MKLVPPRLVPDNAVIGAQDREVEAPLLQTYHVRAFSAVAPLFIVQIVQGDFVVWRPADNATDFVR